MGDIVKRYTMYPVWEYAREEEDLNQSSKNGLQLVQGGCFRSLFHYDNTVRYIYQLDYNRSIVDKARYLETFEDRGWEYINSTWNGWHYFRKPYEEGMTEEDSHIYTDRASLQEMQRRFGRLLLGAIIFYVLAAPFYLYHGFQEHVPALQLEGIVFLIMALCFGLGLYSMKSRSDGMPGGILMLARILLPISLILAVFSVFLM